MQWTIRKTTLVFIAATGVCILLLTQWQTHSQTSPESPCQVKQLATPLSFLTPAQKTDFFAGCDEFMEVETIDDGLGPVFNGKSCAECHAVPSVGGSEPNVGVARETRIGGLHGDQLVSLGGPLLQQRAISDPPECEKLVGEKVPPEATFVSLRNSPPLFGAGLIESITEKTITNRKSSGRPNRVFNPDTKGTELGRFGWKAQVATLHQFAGDAYLNEMGITNKSFPAENKPQGQEIPAGCDKVPEPEDFENRGVDAFTNFMRFLARRLSQCVQAPTAPHIVFQLSSCLAVNGAVFLPAHFPLRTPGTPCCDRLHMYHIRTIYGAWTQNLAHDPPHASGTPDAPGVAAVKNHPCRAGQTGPDYPPPG
jgi:Di-haem oxidoreductase, putative peroxidase